MVASKYKRIEWLTILLIVAVYAVLITLVVNHAWLPWWVILPFGAYAAALHVSLQHEILHGHPTRSRFVNDALLFVAPHMWLPYERYRQTHLQHHNDLYLTDPVKDPESYYMLPDDWGHLPGLKQALYRFNNTLFGRMSIGPAVSIVRFWGTELLAIAKGDFKYLRAWVLFAISCSIVISFVHWAGMPLWQYILLIAYPAISLALVRSFCEHQATEKVSERTIIVEASPFWSLLFLFNNLHVVHHDRPTIAWYKLPALYRAERDQILAKNNNYLMHGYSEIFRRYFFKAKEPVAYPNVNWLKR